MKKSFNILKAVFAVIGVVLVVAIIGVILLINHNKNVLTINGSTMLPTLKSGQKVHVNAKTGVAPQRGDIVELTAPGLPSSSKALVLRVVGIPGDHVVIANGHVTVSNTQNPNSFNPDASYLSSNTITAGQRDVMLQAKQYYVLGDNRSNALDSREFGLVMASQIIGKITP